MFAKKIPGQQQQDAIGGRHAKLMIIKNR